jgi:hypothetical protein
MYSSCTVKISNMTIYSTLLKMGILELKLHKVWISFRILIFFKGKKGIINQYTYVLYSVRPWFKAAHGMVQEADVGNRHCMLMCSLEWETNSLAGKIIDLQSLASQWPDRKRLTLSVIHQGSSAPQDPGDFHPGGFRNMTIWIACMGLMS